MARVNVEQLLKESPRFHREGPRVIDGKAVVIARRPSVEDAAKQVPPPQHTPNAPHQAQPQNKAEEPEAEQEPKYVVPPGPLRQLDPNRLHTKTQVMEQLNRLAPMNRFNLPDYVYRVDLIDHAMMLDSLRRLREDPTRDVATAVHDMLVAATVYLDFSEGFPKIQQVPFWQQLDFEPVEAYAAFEQYLLLEGVRQLRSLISFKADDLSSWFHMYMWEFRVRAYDMYVIAHHRKQSIQRSLSLEDKHFRMAEAMLTEIQNKIRDKGPEFYENMEPKDAIAMVERLVKIQRVSVGLPAQGAPAIQALPKAPSTVAMLEHIAGVENREEADQRQIADELADDPDALQKAQDLILHLQGGSEPSDVDAGDGGDE